MFYDIPKPMRKITPNDLSWLWQSASLEKKQDKTHNIPIVEQIWEYLKQSCQKEQKIKQQLLPILNHDASYRTRLMFFEHFFAVFFGCIFVSTRKSASM